MKLTITLTDTENGHVKIDSDPDMEQIIKAGRSATRTPAEGYAVVALAAMVEHSARVLKEVKGIEGHTRIKLH